MIVLSWAKATRDLLKSFSWGIGALRQLFASDDGAISFAACPIPSLRRCRPRSPPCRRAKPRRYSREASIFARFARWAARQFGRSIAFTLAFLTIIVWAATGPLFGWFDTWQLVINTGTTIVTFLMVFVIQNTQSRDTQAMQLKLDELIRVNKIARNSLINLEEMSEADVERMKAAFAALAPPEAPLRSAPGAEGALAK